MPAKIPLYQDIRLYTFWGIIAFLFFHHGYGYFGHYGFDDIMGYGFYAKKWADGQLFYLNEDFFSYRWGFIALTGLSYALFGMSDISSAVVPTLVLLATVLLLFYNLKDQRRIIAVTAALLLVLDNWTLYYADKLMPDTLVALMVFAAFSVVYNFRYFGEGHKAIWHAFLLSFVLFVGYLTKQSILLLFPVFFILFVLDIVQGKYQKFWLFTMLFCVSFGLAYLALIYILTGDPFMRFHAVEQGLDDNLGSGQSFSFCNYALQPWSVLLYRIGFEMMYKFMATGMMISLMFGMAGVFQYNLKEMFFKTNAQTYWPLIFLLSFLSANFMTTSYKAYLPICPDIRHFLFLVPIAVLVAAPLIFKFAQQHKNKKLILAALAIVFLLAYTANTGNMLWVYAALLLLTLLKLRLPLHPKINGGFLLVLLALAALPAFSSMYSARQNAYHEQRKVIYEYLKPLKQRSVVFSNVIQTHYGRYYLEFDPAAAVQFEYYDAIATFNFDTVESVYVLTNGSTRFMSNLRYEDLPRCIRACYEGKIDPQIKPIYQTNQVALYKIEQVTLLNQ
jgi:hypothetical protein